MYLDSPLFFCILNYRKIQNNREHNVLPKYKSIILKTNQKTNCKYN